MKKCARCGIEKSEDNFCKSRRMKDGYQSACKLCMADSWRKSREKKKDHYKAVQKDREKRNRSIIKEWKRAQRCFVCGESDPCCLDLHHTDPSEKEFNPSDIAHISVAAFMNEASKCIVLCANCHRKVHAGAINLNLGVAQVAEH